MLIGSVKLTKNADVGKEKYSGYSLGFHSRRIRIFIYRRKRWKNVIICGADMSPSVNIDNKKKEILIIGEGTTQGLDDTTLTAEAK